MEGRNAQPGGETDVTEFESRQLDKQQLFSALVMVGASRRELGALHSVQLPGLGVKNAEVLEPLQQAEACVLQVEELLRGLAKVSYPEMEVPWEINDQIKDSV